MKVRCLMDGCFSRADTRTDIYLRYESSGWGESMVHIFNINTKDNHEEAAIGATHALLLVQLVWPISFQHFPSSLHILISPILPISPISPISVLSLTPPSVFIQKPFSSHTWPSLADGGWRRVGGSRGQSGGGVYKADGEDASLQRTILLKKSRLFATGTGWAVACCAVPLEHPSGPALVWYLRLLKGRTEGPASTMSGVWSAQRSEYRRVQREDPSGHVHPFVRGGKFKLKFKLIQLINWHPQ